MQKQLPFSLEEYQSRLNQVRQRMLRQGMDVVLINSPENIFYLTGYQYSGLLL